MNSLGFDASAVKGILFDLDGTLVDSLPDLHAAVAKALEKRGLEPMSMQEVERFVGKGVIHLAGCVLRYRRPEASEDEILSFIRDYVDILSRDGGTLTRVIPGVKEALEKFASAGIPLALVTNKAGALIPDTLRTTGLDAFFRPELCFSPECVKTPKPAPDMLLLAAQTIGVPAASCLMMGDSLNDAQAASAAGMPVMLLETGYNEGTPIRQWGMQNGFGDIFRSMDEAADAFFAARP